MDGVQHRGDEFGVDSKEAPQRYRERQHPLAHRHARQDVVHQIGGGPSAQPLIVLKIPIKKNTYILTFDEVAAEAYANLVSRASRAGHTFSVGDAQIAAIATTRNFIVATRDTTPFVAAGVTVINPWEAGAEK